jgi:hypothetical protein
LTTVHSEVNLGTSDSAGGYPRGVRISKQLTRTWALFATPGSSRVLKYLADTNAASRKNMNALIGQVDRDGFHHSDTRYKRIEGPLVEYKVKKPKAIRVVAYRLPDGGHVLLLGFDKSDGPTPPQVMKAARKLAAEFEKGGLQLD